MFCQALPGKRSSLVLVPAFSKTREYGPSGQDQLFLITKEIQHWQSPVFSTYIKCNYNFIIEKTKDEI